LQYFHVVFTLLAEIAGIALWNKRAIYGLLFRASAETVANIAADPKRLGARVGLTPGGSRWVACKPGFFLHVRVLPRLFRRLFVEGLVALHRTGKLAFFSDLA
jgi:hypothetical protein